jgi:hypothetical protein
MRSSLMLRSLFGVCAACAIAVVACTTTTTSTIPLGPQHLYVTDGASPSTIYVYDLPVSPTSTPAVTLLTAGNRAQNPCFDFAGHVYIPMEGDGNIQVFTLPLAASSIQAFSLVAPGGFPEDCHFDPAGNMYIAGTNVPIYKAPVQAGAALGTTITDQVVGPFGVWTDSTGDLFVAETADITEYSPFAAGNTLLAKFGTIVGGNNFGVAIGPTGSLYVPNGTARNQIDVYDPSFSNASTRNAAKTITVQTLTATNFLTWVGFDRAGNLYVGASDDTTPANHVYVLAPPYTSVTVDLNTGVKTVRGMAIGP